MAELLCAYGEIAGKTRDWAEQIVAQWEQELSRQRADGEFEEELEYPIKRALVASSPDNAVSSERVTFEGELGTLYITEVGALLSSLRLQNQRDLVLPKNSTGLGRRLRSSRFRVLKFPTEDSAAQLPQLKRARKRRPIGFFIADDAGVEGVCDDDGKT